MKRTVAVVGLLSSFVVSSASAQEAAPSNPPAANAPAEEKGDTEIRLNLRTGLQLDISPGELTFYGFGAVVEPTVSINDQLGLGLRIDGIALFGVNLGDDVAAGVRALAAIAPKVEYRFWRGPVQLFAGLSGGYYTVAIAGASVSGDREDVGAIAGGGRVFGLAPQVGLELGSFRIAPAAHLLFGGGVDPVFALEFSWNSLSIPLSK